MNVLAIDQGTSGTKAVVWNPDEGVVAGAEAVVRPRYLADGGVEQDPEELLASVLSAGNRALSAAGRPVAAVALANQGETVLAWDRQTGTPLSAAVVWQDRRSETLCRERAGHAETVLAATGLPLDPYFSAPKMAWLRRQVTTEGVVTTSDSWLVHHLTGAFVTDRSTASRSLLVPLEGEDWDRELLAGLDLEGEQLPTIVSSDDVVGTTSAFGAAEVPVSGLIVDQQAALFAQGCLAPATAKCTFGTGAFLLANTGGIATRPKAGLAPSVAWRLRGATTYCLDGQVYTAASAMRWLQDLGVLVSPQELDTAAAPDSGGVLCVPALAGLGAPWWRSTATATLTGMTLATGRGEVIRAVLEGVAAQVAELCRLVAADTGTPLARLRVDGGLTRSAALMQAQADLAQLPVEVFPSAEATALGAAGLARTALEPETPLEHALGEWEPARCYEPRWSRDRAEDFLERWRRLVDLDPVGPGYAGATTEESL